MSRLAGLTACLLVAVTATDAAVVARHTLVAPEARLEPAPSDRTAATVDPTTSAARDFLDRYVTRDGRVVRHDQGGDTVSEGQAYAMLLALVVGDHPTFRRVWGWTRAHLRRDDGLLAWHWADGRVVDEQPAADADLDAAWALALADRRWPSSGYGTAASELARAAVAAETALMPDGRSVLVPGPWARARAARGDGLVLNPSYSSPVGEDVLVDAGHLAAPESEARRATMRDVVDGVVGDGDLPTDWVVVSSDGAVRGIAAPEDAGPGRFGWDAVRVPLRLAASCDDDDRALAARFASALRDGAGSQAMGDHPARLVSVASALAADGETRRANDLLDQATRDQADAPTYYGGALIALARALLTTDRLGGCPPA